jgi:Ferritin-like
MNIIELMQTPRDQQDIGWLKKMLQFAIELEISTLPPYLSGLWTISSGSGPVYDLILSIVDEEMVHLGLACNMLTAIGGTPSIYAPFQNKTIHYPGHLPGGVRPELIVHLAGLSKDYVQKIYMQIEYPQGGPVALALGQTYPTIGAFYSAILEGFQTIKPALSQSNQLAVCFGQENLPCPEDMLQVFVVSTLAEVEEAITEIKEQGEGSSQTPDSPDFGKEPVTGKFELAHYYKFGEIYHEKELVQVNGKWQYTGAAVPFPAVIPVKEIPAGGYQNPPADVHAAIQGFNQIFANLLETLESAWLRGSELILQNAINTMFTLQPAAAKVLAFQMPDGSYYGPTFDVNDV